nr:PilZ domain-containing protein [uncultured Desulfobacter sp.]
MTDNFLKDDALLEEIMSHVRSLTQDLQKDVLAYILNLKEPRSYPRVTRPIEMDVSIDDKVIQTDAENLSAAGVLIKSRMSPDIGIPVRIVFSLPGQARPFKLTGTVVRTDMGRIGIYFSEMAPYAREHLNNLIQAL